MTHILQDLRYGLRILWKSPGFTIVAVTALALGIGANTAIFSVVNAVLLRPLPFDQPDQIVRLLTTHPRKGIHATSQSYLNFNDIREQCRSFENVSAFTEASTTLTGGGAAEQVNGILASAEIFDVLRAKPELGRTFSREDERNGGSQSIVISHEMWQTRFASDPGVINRTIVLDGKSRSIIGVMPASVNFLFVNKRPEYWMPLDPKNELAVQRGAHYLEVIARLKPGIDIRQAETEAQAISAGLEKMYPDDNTDQNVALIFERENMVGNVRSTLLIILGAVGFVLLIACANVANLLLARASGRGREIALRAALGATRFRIVWQLLTESVILALIGGVLGLFLAVWGVDVLGSIIPPSIPRVHETGLDSTVLSFTLGATVFTGILFGLAPAFQMSRIELNESLKEGGRSSTSGRGSHRLRGLLVISEVALSVLLLVSAGLLIRSFFALRNVNPGFRAENVLTASVALPESVYKEDAAMLEFYNQVIDRTRHLPGVESAAAIMPLPLSNDGMSTTFSVDGEPDPGPGQRPLSSARIITPEYFKSMGIPVVRGRALTDNDTGKSPKVIVINETLARQFFSNDDPIGRRLKVGLNDINGEIVGVVADVRHRHLDAESGPEYYLPLSQIPINSMSLVVRTTVENPAQLSSSLRDVVHGLDGNLSVFDIRPMSQLVTEAIARQRFSMTLLALFAGLALALAVVGIFSVMSSLVALRTHEFGIRMALGAQNKNIGLVIKQGLILVTFGLAIGIVFAIGVTRIMQSMLFGVGPRDPLTIVGVSLTLAFVALAACLAPALRAVRVDPMVALRDE